MNGIVRIRIPTGEPADDHVEEIDGGWDEPDLGAVDLSASDLGCAPGTRCTAELVDESGQVLDSRPIVAT
jgi:hypothetical protein